MLSQIAEELELEEEALEGEVLLGAPEVGASLEVVVLEGVALLLKTTALFWNESEIERFPLSRSYRFS